MRGHVAAVASRGARSALPALPGARGHELWKRDFRLATGLFTIVLHPDRLRERFAAMLDRMRLFRMGWSWGGFRA
jgi:cystathionine beta-lyase